MTDFSSSTLAQTTPAAALAIDADRIINDSRFGSYQLLVAVLCGLCLIIDGFDAQAMGYVAPAVLHDWNITKKELLTPAFSAGLFGMLIGSLAFSALADKIGRRPVLVGATFAFAICMIGTGFANTITELVIWRFATGLGLGCLMPNAMALASEYTPRRVRVTLMMWVSCCYTVGGVVGGLFSAELLRVLNWRAVFWIGGVVPLILGLVMLAKLPEAIHFLLLRAQRTNNDTPVRRQLGRIAAAPLATNAPLLMPVHKQSAVPFVELFRYGRTLITLLLWIVNFANLVNMYFLANWLPTVIHEAGYTATTAVLAGSMLWGGGVVGTLLLGFIIARVGFLQVLAAIFFMLIFTVAAIGNPGVIANGSLLFTAIFLTGFAIMGGQPAINALAAVYYPSTLRATGIGWGLGIGRIGSVIGPSIAGLLIHWQWSLQALFLAAAVPACVSLLAVSVIHFLWRPEVDVQELPLPAH